VDLPEERCVQRLIMKRHLEPICFDDLENFLMDATHFKTKNIREEQFQQSLSCRACSKMIKDDNRCLPHDSECSWDWISGSG
ncbi:hypothetical protein EVAR_7816_1, partial [Eumeta japonica]